METNNREIISEKRLKCVFTVNDGSTSSSPKMTANATGNQQSENSNEKALTQASISLFITIFSQ